MGRLVPSKRAWGKREARKGRRNLSITRAACNAGRSGSGAARPVSASFQSLLPASEGDERGGEAMSRCWKKEPMARCCCVGQAGVPTPPDPTAPNNPEAV